MSEPRYVLEAEPAVIARLDTFLSRLAADLAAQPFRTGVAALVLGGGYGRGEGGVFRVTEGAAAALYNDLEFFIFVRLPSASAEVSDWCHRWERAGTTELGIDVEFKVLAADVLASAEPTMFYFDLLQGHRLVRGDAGILHRAPSRLRDPQRIPLTEPTRLLFNRGTGLLFARWRLEEAPDDPDGFVERNHAKAKLALADAVLAAAGRHDGSCRCRAARIARDDFARPPRFDQLQAWHAEGVSFKLQPRHRHPGAAALAAENRRLTAAWRDTFLWLESRRLRAEWPGCHAYVRWPARLFPESRRGVNFLLHLRDRVRRGAALPGWSDYPRAALQRALVASLLDENDDTTAAACLGSDPAVWRSDYRRWWGCYN